MTNLAFPAPDDAARGGITHEQMQAIAKRLAAQQAETAAQAERDESQTVGYYRRLVEMYEARRAEEIRAEQERRYVAQLDAQRRAYRSQGMQRVVRSTALVAGCGAVGGLWSRHVLGAVVGSAAGMVIDALIGG